MSENLSQLCKPDLIQKITLSLMDYDSFRGAIFLHGWTTAGQFWKYIRHKHIISPSQTYMSSLAVLMDFQ